MVKLSVFIPAYNEGKILEKNILKVYEELNRLKYNFELFIVDDSSKDSTPDIGRKLAKKYNKIKFVRYPNGPSRRENLAKSFQLAEGDTIMFMDSDLSTDLTYLPKLVERIGDGFDIVTGSRHLKNSKVKRSFSRWLISLLFKWFAKLYFGSRVNDHECGFKAFKKDIILDLLKDMGYDNKFKRKMFWDTEMFVRAQRKGYKIKEIPVRWKAGEKSALSFFKELSMVPYMLSLRFRLGKK